MGKHRIEIVPAKSGERGAFTVKDLATQPIAHQATIASAYTGEQIPVPDGSVRNYLNQHAQELGGEDAYVKLVIHYKPDAGEQPRQQQPPNWQRLPAQ